MRPLRATDTELLGPLCEDEMGQKWLGPHENVQQQAQLAVQPSIDWMLRADAVCTAVTWMLRFVVRCLGHARTGMNEDTFDDYGSVEQRIHRSELATITVAAMCFRRWASICT